MASIILIKFRKNLTEAIRAPVVYLRHLRALAERLRIDAVGPETVEQVTDEDPVAEQLGKVEDRRLPGRQPVIARQHVAADEPFGARPPVVRRSTHDGHPLSLRSSLPLDDRRFSLI